MEQLAELDELGEQLSQAYSGARMDDVDLDKLARQVGDQAAVDARALADLERALQQTGYVKRGEGYTSSAPPPPRSVAFSPARPPKHAERRDRPTCSTAAPRLLPTA